MERITQRSVLSYTFIYNKKDSLNTVFFIRRRQTVYRCFSLL
ncbi:hypothetical protein BC059799_4783 [Bacillus cereus NVH0597-99]|nr:hypothetical protein BC059799_4783 [Bacillus cereus NVH0597-99]